MFPSGSYYAPIAAIASSGAGVQKLTISASSVSSTALGTAAIPVTAVEICASTNCYFRVGTGGSVTAVNTDTYLPGNQIRYLQLKAGQDRIAFIQDTAGGFVTITPVYT